MFAVAGYHAVVCNAFIAIISLSEAYLWSINESQMKLDTSREGSEKKSFVQEPKPFHKLLRSYYPSWSQ